MMTVLLASLPILLVIGLGFAHVMKRRSISAMPDYAELPRPPSDETRS